MNTIKRVVVLTCACLALAAAAARAAEPSVSELLDGLKSSDEAARVQAVDQLGAEAPRPPRPLRP